MPTDPRYTYYKMLMLAEIADQEIISSVYRKLAQRYHPDIDMSPEAARRMAEINEAYATLRDAEKRRKYDAWLASRRDRRRTDRLQHLTASLSRARTAAAVYEVVLMEGREALGANAGLIATPSDDGTSIELSATLGFTIGSRRFCSSPAPYCPASLRRPNI